MPVSCPHAVKRGANDRVTEQVRDYGVAGPMDCGHCPVGRPTDAFFRPHDPYDPARPGGLVARARPTFKGRDLTCSSGAVIILTSLQREVGHAPFVQRLHLSH